MRTQLTCFFLFIFAGMQPTVSAQHPTFELTGTMSFDVADFNGMIRSAAIVIGDGGSGPFQAIMTGDTSLTTHTIFRPADLSSFGADRKLPIVAYANGGCRNGSGEVRNLLSEIASHGFLVLAIGPLANTLGGLGEFLSTESRQLTEGIDWALAETERPESPYSGKIDAAHVAVMGQSCGGLQALAVVDDPRITTVVLLNSGVLPATDDGLPAPRNRSNAFDLRSVTKADLENLHTPIAYFLGGAHDMATPNGADDFARIDHVPALLATYDFSEEVEKTGNRGIGHYPATYRAPNGGDFGIAVAAWLEWQLKKSEEASMMFKGEDCGLCRHGRWTVSKKGID